jgi:hypothetical protein
VVAAQGRPSLVDHDRWFRRELTAQRPTSITLDDLVRLAEWKMHRGVYRGRNLALVRSNDPADVERVSRAAIALAPSLDRPVAQLAALKGVGPATASAVLSAARPDAYPFFDDVVASQVPGVSVRQFSESEYRRYAEALRRRAAALGEGWSPSTVEQALWAYAGGKAGIGALSKL